MRNCSTGQSFAVSPRFQSKYKLPRTDDDGGACGDEAAAQVTSMGTDLRWGRLKIGHMRHALWRKSFEECGSVVLLLSC